jgi:hypothetical protein
MRRFVALFVLVLAGVWGVAGTASAAAASLHVSPTRVAAGGAVHVTGTCDPNTAGFAISRAFLHDAAHEFAGVGAVSFTSDSAGNFSADARIPSDRAPGTYGVTGRCGGGNLGVSVTLVVTSAGAPTAVPAGSGGEAAATSSATRALQMTMVGLGVVLLGSGGLAIARLRRHPR